MVRGVVRGVESVISRITGEKREFNTRRCSQRKSAVRGVARGVVMGVVRGVVRGYVSYLWSMYKVWYWV